jgi:quinolinate synthase
MCYVNSTAAIKAMSDVCCTSANALAISRKLPADKGIIFVPDEHLGDFIMEQTGRDMVLWKGFCPTHVKITPEMLQAARTSHPDAVIMIHPEAPRECRHLADQVLSTGGMCRFVSEDSHEKFVVATEVGIIHTLQKQNPQKQFVALDAELTCPNMKLGSLASVEAALAGSGGQVVRVDEDTAAKARVSLERMLELSA